MWHNGKDERYPGPVAIRRNQDFLKSLDRSVSRNYADKSFGLVALSTDLSLSKRQVQRRLKMVAGRTPSKYLRSYRLRQSLELLNQGMQVGQVAKAVGFSSQAYFASCFKAEFGQTPTCYQKQHI